MRTPCLAVMTVICCSCTTSRTNHVVNAATPDERAALLGRVKTLAGTWETDGQGGEKQTVTFQVSSSGSAVRELMFPGSDHEMTNMYTMDGADLLMTHYCAAGNQPHMRAASSEGDRIEFKTAGVSNLTAPDQQYMGQMTIVFIDAAHIRQQWQSMKNGAFTDDNLTIELTRKQ